MTGSDIAPSPEDIEGNRVYLSLHVDLRGATMQGLGDNVSITDSKLRLEQTLLKLVLANANNVQINLSGTLKLPASIIDFPDATAGHLERVQRLEEMVDALAIQTTSTKELVLVGVTGAGKTELAIAYARQYQAAMVHVDIPPTSSSSSQGTSPRQSANIRPFIYFIDARREYYLASFEGLALYNNPETGEGLGIDVKWLRETYKPDASTEAYAKYETQLAKQIHQRLKAYPGWLLILDGISEVKANVTYLKPWIPKGQGLIGTVLYTSQDTCTSFPQTEMSQTSTPTYLPIIDITSGLSDTESIALLERLTGMREDDAGSALTLARALDKLPLALQVAGRYIAAQHREGETDASDYVLYLTKHQDALALLNQDQEVFCQELGLATSQYAAIDLSVQSLPTEAKALLDVCSLLCDRGLPEELLRGYTIGFLGQNLNASIKADIAINALRKHGLLNIESQKQKTWFLHHATHAYAWLSYQKQLSLTPDNIAPIQHLLMIFAHPLYQDETLPNLVLQSRAGPHAIAFLVKCVGPLFDYISAKEAQLAVVYGLCACGVMAIHLGEYGVAVMLFTKAESIAEPYGTDDFLMALILFSLGNTYYLLGCFELAHTIQRRVLGILEGLSLDTGGLPVAATLISLGSVCAALGDVKEQQVLLLRALSIIEQRYGSDHHEVAKAQMNLANTYAVLGDAEQAQLLLSNVLATLESYYGSEHPQVALVLVNLGHVYIALGDAKQAQMLLLRALNISENYYGTEHPEITAILINLGTTYSALSDPKQAKILLLRALAINEHHYNPNHPETAIILSGLGDVYNELGATKQAEEALLRALHIFKECYGDDNYNLAMVAVNLAITYIALDDNLDRPQTLFQQALSISERHYGLEHPKVALILSNLGNVYRELGDASKGRILLLRALAIYERHYGLEHHETVTTLKCLGAAYLDLRDPEQAQASFVRALTISEQYYGIEHPNLVSILIFLCATYEALGNTTQVLATSQRVLSLLEKHNDEDDSKGNTFDTIKHKIAFYRMILEEAEKSVALLLQHATNTDLADAVAENVQKVLYQTFEDIRLLQLRQDPVFLEQLSLLMKLLLLNPQQISLYYESLADLLIGYNEILSAISYYELAITMDAINSTAYHSLACCYRRLNHRDKARATFELGLQYQPNAGLMAEYAHFLWHTEDVLSAAIMISRCLSQPEEERSLIYGEASVAVIEPGLRALVEQYPDKIIILSAHSLVLYLQCLYHLHHLDNQEERYTQSLTAFRAYVSTHPTETHHDMLASVYILHGDIKESDFHRCEAQRLREHALTIDTDETLPKAKKLFLFIMDQIAADGWVMTKDVEQAVYGISDDLCIQQLIESNAEFAQSWVQLTVTLLLNELCLGVYYQKLADLLLRFDAPLPAISYYRRSIKTDEVNSTAYHNLACCYLVVNRHDKARETFELGLRYQPKTNLMAEYAHFLWQIGDIPSAVSMISRCLSEPEDEAGLSYGQTEIAVIEPDLRVLVEQRPDKSIALSPHSLALYLQCLYHHSLAAHQQMIDIQPLIAFKAYVSIYPTETHHDMLASIYTLYGDTKEASFHQDEAQRLREQALSISANELSASMSEVASSQPSSMSLSLAQASAKSSTGAIGYIPQTSEPTQASSSSSTTQHIETTAQPLFSGIFTQTLSSSPSNAALQPLFDLYKTDDKDKALRNAAVNGRIKDVRLLLRHGANVNACDSNPASQKTALHHAAIKGNEEMMTLLRIHGADDSLVDAQGKTAQDYATTSMGMRMGRG